MTDKRASARRDRIGAGQIEPAQIETGDIEKWGLSYVERFASSAENLRRVLLRRVRRRLGPEGDPAVAAELAQAIDHLIARYCASGLLDDAAYAASRARTRLGRGQSLRKIRAGLAAKGVAAAPAAAAIEALRTELADPELAAACAFARRRRLGPFRRSTADSEQRGRELGAFARAGFDRRTAEAVLACSDPDEVAALCKEGSPR